jgi:opacity protein-like surface antigen
MESKMKNVIKVFTVLIFVISSRHVVLAEESITKKNWYGRFGMGYAQQIDNYNEVNGGQSAWEFDGGPNFTISTGYDANFWALEGELAYRKMDIGNRISKRKGRRLSYTGDQSQISLMLNGYLYPKSDWTISPYLGIGFGVTKISWNNIRYPRSSSFFDDSDNVFTYQLIIGVSHKITSQLVLEADYRYFVPNDVEITSSAGAVGKLDNQELNIFGVSIKYKF